MKEQNDKIENEIVLELSFRLQMRDFKFRLPTKRAWLIAALLFCIRIATYLLRDALILPTANILNLLIFSKLMVSRCPTDGTETPLSSCLSRDDSVPLVKWVSSRGQRQMDSQVHSSHDLVKGI